jgi:hypothetical protein
LASAHANNLFVKILAEARDRRGFALVAEPPVALKD